MPSDASGAATTRRLYHFTSKPAGLAALWEKRLKVARYGDLVDPAELTPFDRSDPWFGAWWAEQVDRVLAGDHGLLCFSDQWREPRLWSQYADRHTGLCLGFDVPAVYAEPVRYIDAPLPNPWAAHGAALPAPPVEVLEAALRHKPALWRHEREWRLRVQLGRSSDGVHHKAFDDELHLREVILGPRCSLTLADVIEAVAAPPLDVDIFQADTAVDAFEVRKHALASTHTARGFRAVLAQARNVYAHDLLDDEDDASEAC